MVGTADAAAHYHDVVIGDIEEIIGAPSHDRGVQEQRAPSFRLDEITLGSRPRIGGAEVDGSAQRDVTKAGADELGVLGVSRIVRRVEVERVGQRDVLIEVGADRGGTVGTGDSARGDGHCAGAETGAIRVITQLGGDIDVLPRRRRDEQRAREGAQVTRQVVGVAIDRQGARPGDSVVDDVVVVGADGERAAGGDAEGTDPQEAARAR